MFKPFSVCFRLVNYALLALTGMLLNVTALDRVPNTTLQMPNGLPDAAYTVEDAFAGMTFRQPVGIVTAPGDNDRVFILEKEGRIQLVSNLSSPTKSVFLDIVSRVNSGREGGLLGLAFHPNFQNNRYFYVFYTAPPNGDGVMIDRLSRFEISASNPNQAVPGSELILINQVDHTDTHNAGDLHFGPDGYLYISLGDEGGGGDRNANSQLIDRDFFSAIARIDVDKRPGNLAPNSHEAATSNYSVPSDNPFIGATSFNGQSVNPSDVRTEFWAVGFRNPWRMSFDRVTGTLYVADVGQEQWEEVDVVVRGGNYGWKYREGANRYTGTPPAGMTLVDPIFQYNHSTGSSISGGLVYRGSRMPELTGEYIFGDYVAGSVWAVRFENGNASNFRRLTGASGPAAFGADPRNGDILIAENSANRIRRLVHTGGSSPNFPSTLAGTGAFSSLSSLTPAAGVVPYDLNVAFWSDGALKSRWFSIPDTSDRITYHPTNNWLYPEGSVWIKHFELELIKGDPSSQRRLETRLIVRNPAGVYGVTYRWGTSTSDATLVPDAGMNESFVIRDGSTTRTQVWRYPSRSECLTCHTEIGGYALGFSTAQLNRTFNMGDGNENQVQALSGAGYFHITAGNPQTLPALKAANDTSASLEQRARSYLAANCVNCHQPGGTGNGNFDTRFFTPTISAGLVNGALLNNYGNSSNRVIRPMSPAHSMLLTRLSATGTGRMPPVGSSVHDTNGMQLLTSWIQSMQPPSAPSNLRIVNP